MDGRASLLDVLDGARAAGAKAAEAIRIDREVLELTASRARPTSSNERVWRVRVYREGGATGVGEGETAREALRLAVLAAERAPPDPHAGPAERMTIAAGALGVDDRRHTGISDTDRAEVLTMAERPLAVGGVNVQHLLYRQVRERRAWMSTRGVEAEGGATTYSLAATVRAGSWDVRHAIASRHFSDVASLPFGTELRKRCEVLANAGQLPTSPLGVVLEPRVVAELVRSIAPVFAADRAPQTFLAGFLGARLATPALHLTDDAGLTSGLYSRAFDDRGVPPIPVALLKEGVVSGLYHDPETARAAGLRPTGHVTEGTLRPTNLVVRPGGRTRNVLLAELKEYLLLDRLPPLDVISGRYTGEVPVIHVRPGERPACARARIDVDVPALLASIRELAADQERNGEVDAPTAVLEGVALT